MQLTFFSLSVISQYKTGHCGEFPTFQLTLEMYTLSRLEAPNSTIYKNVRINMTL